MVAQAVKNQEHLEQGRPGIGVPVFHCVHGKDMGSSLFGCARCQKAAAAQLALDAAEKRTRDAANVPVAAIVWKRSDTNPNGFVIGLYESGEPTPDGQDTFLSVRPLPALAGLPKAVKVIDLDHWVPEYPSSLVKRWKASIRRAHHF